MAEVIRLDMAAYDDKEEHDMSKPSTRPGNVSMKGDKIDMFFALRRSPMPGVIRIDMTAYDNAQSTRATNESTDIRPTDLANRPIAKTVKRTTNKKNTTTRKTVTTSTTTKMTTIRKNLKGAWIWRVEERVLPNH